MSLSRTTGLLTGALLFIIGFALLFTLVGALVGLILMGEGLGLAVVSTL
jgi:hypothetical protein